METESHLTSGHVGSTEQDTSTGVHHMYVTSSSSQHKRFLKNLKLPCMSTLSVEFKTQFISRINFVQMLGERLTSISDISNTSMSSTGWHLDRRAKPIATKISAELKMIHNKAVICAGRVESSSNKTLQ